MTHHDHHIMDDFFRRKELNHFYLSVSITAFSLGLISIFVPIFLYQLGISIAMIVIYFGLTSLYYCLISYPIARVVAKFGAKHAMLYSFVFFIIYYFLLSGLQSVGFLFYLLPLVNAIGLTFYNFGYHLNYSRHSNKDRRGHELSFIYIMIMIVGSVSPLVGSFLAEINFTLLFIVGSLLLVISSIPLILTKDSHDELNFSLEDVMRRMMTGLKSGMVVSYFGFGVDSFISKNIWPIFLIIILESLTKTGMILGISTLFSILIFSFIGIITDRYDKVKIIKFGAILHLFGWLWRIFVNTPVEILMVDSYKNVSDKVISIPWWARSYDIASRENYFLYTVMREVSFNLSRVFMAPVMALVFYLDFYPFILTFIIAILFGFTYLFVGDKK